MPKLKSKGLPPKDAKISDYCSPIKGTGETKKKLETFWSKKTFSPERKKVITLNEIPQEYDIVVVRAEGYWYVDIMDRILKCKVATTKDAVMNFEEALSDAYSQIRKD